VRGLGTITLDVRAGLVERCATDQHGLGVPSAERPALFGATGLVDHRRTLPRRLGQVWACDLVVRADVVDVAHLRRIGVDPLLDVLDDRVVVPGAFPELVEHFQVLVGDLVTTVVVYLVAQAEVAGRVGQVGRHRDHVDQLAGQQGSARSRRHCSRRRSRIQPATVRPSAWNSLCRYSKEMW
jgi:hypothetical protein